MYIYYYCRFTVCNFEQCPYYAPDSRDSRVSFPLRIPGHLLLFVNKRGVFFSQSRCVMKFISEYNNTTNFRIFFFSLLLTPIVTHKTHQGVERKNTLLLRIIIPRSYRSPGERWMNVLKILFDRGSNHRWVRTVRITHYMKYF